jgi:hypothetical protein
MNKSSLHRVGVTGGEHQEPGLCDWHVGAGGCGRGWERPKVGIKVGAGAALGGWLSGWKIRNHGILLIIKLLSTIRHYGKMRHA